LGQSLGFFGEDRLATCEVHRALLGIIGNKSM